MYYGAERLRDVKFLRQQDIVLTTYPTLTNDYSRVSSVALCACMSSAVVGVRRLNDRDLCGHNFMVHYLWTGPI